MRKISQLLLLVALTASSTVAVAQPTPGEGLPQLIKGNERFGRRLLQQVHSSAPNKNVVVAPLSITVLLTAIQVNSNRGATHKQIGSVFGWGEYPRLTIPSHMLLAAFEPLPTMETLRRRQKAYDSAWVTNTVHFRLLKGRNPFSERFANNAAQYFGMKLVSTGHAEPDAASVRANRATGPLPKIREGNDVWFTSGVHLQTAWFGNTFSMSTAYGGIFHTVDGRSRRVQLLDSQLEEFGYAKRERFEAVSLPGRRAYMVAVVPAPGVTIQELEQELTVHPAELDASLESKPGIVTMPIFRMDFEKDFAEAITALGITDIFEDLGEIVKAPKSRITTIAQRVELSVDKEGMHANAETVAGAVYGGILSAQPFQMRLDRPFVFLIRDQITDALLFAGALMDPTEGRTSLPSAPKQ